MIFQIPSAISKITTMANRSLRLQVDTQEDIPPTSMEKLMNVFDKFGWFTFSVEEIQAEDLADLPTLDVPKGRKTKSQQLREAIWIYGIETGHYTSDEKKKAGEFYDKQMDKLIDFVRSKV